MPVRLADIFTERDHAMARAVGGPAGTNPIGDRPGTTTAVSIGSWRGTAAGRARLIAYGAFGVLIVLHVAAENRIQ